MSLCRSVITSTTRCDLGQDRMGKGMSVSAGRVHGTFDMAQLEQDLMY